MSEGIRTARPEGPPPSFDPGRIWYRVCPHEVKNVAGDSGAGQPEAPIVPREGIRDLAAGPSGLISGTAPAADIVRRMATGATRVIRRGLPGLW